MDDRLEKLRLEKHHNRPWVGQDKILVGVMKALTSNDTETKSETGKRAEIAAKLAVEAENKELGIVVKKRKQGVKGGGTSKGGNIGKKEREIMGMTKENMGMD